MKTTLPFLFIIFTKGLMAQYSWNPTNGIPNKFFIHEIVVKSNDSIYIFGMNRLTSSFAGPGVGFSSDGGKNWSVLQTSSFNTWESTIVAAAYLNNKFIIQVYSDLGTYKLYSSIDAKNWVPINSNLPNKYSMGNIVVDGNQQLVCVGIDLGKIPAETWMYRSNNFGLTWNKITPQGVNLPVKIFETIDYSHNKWFLSTRDSNSSYQVYSSSDGILWTQSSTGLPSNFRVRGFTQLSSTLALVIGGSTSQNMYISKDGGVNWTLIATSGLSSHNWQYTNVSSNNNDVFLGAVDNLSNHTIFSSGYTLSNMEQVSELGIYIYPNPASEWIKLVVDGPKHIEYLLTTTTGAVVLSSSFFGNEHLISTLKVSKGIYILHVIDSSHTVVQKILIE